MPPETGSNGSGVTTRTAMPARKSASATDEMNSSPTPRPQQDIFM
jgi:hypothetical protein